jgi:hypothetical protein
VRYDLAISNLVFHNMGGKRFKAYGTAFDALNPGGCFIIGDLFPHGNADIDYLRERSTLINERLRALGLQDKGLEKRMNTRGL